MNDANFDLFKTKINCVHWQADNESDASVLYDCFHNKLACICEESFPVQEKTYRVFKNKYKPWITTAILNSVKEKNKLYIKYMHTKSIESKLIYRN